jgi:transcriptional regulator with XRE-family HTH domain
MSMTPSQARQLGLLVAKARARKGMSLRDLSWKVGVHTSWLGRLEQGDFADPAPDRLARVAEELDIEPGRIDRLTKGSVADGLPGMRTYFRAKYDLTAEQIAQVERYIERLRRAA